MAVTENEFQWGFVDKRVNPRGQANQPHASGAGSIAYNDVQQLRASLAASTAHGVGYYTAARLDNMTKNDMTYAARLVVGSDAAGIR